eukprot:jgi/Mesvir1/3663/Mv14954-RA.1
MKALGSKWCKWLAADMGWLGVKKVVEWMACRVMHWKKNYKKNEVTVQKAVFELYTKPTEVPDRICGEPLAVLHLGTASNRRWYDLNGWYNPVPPATGPCDPATANVADMTYSMWAAVDDVIDALFGGPARNLLEGNSRPDLTATERDELLEDVAREITSLWQTDEIRRRRPSPLDEARGGLHIVEQSLWSAVPRLLRRLSSALVAVTGKPLPLDAAPISIGTWMGGDRDGNPSVTAAVTRDVSYLAQWMAADLYLREVDALRFELSMGTGNAEITEYARALKGGVGHGGSGHPPVRSVSLQRRRSQRGYGEEESRLDRTRPFPGGSADGGHLCGVGDLQLRPIGDLLEMEDHTDTEESESSGADDSAHGGMAFQPGSTAGAGPAAHPAAAVGSSQDGAPMELSLGAQNQGESDVAMVSPLPGAATLAALAEAKTTSAGAGQSTAGDKAGSDGLDARSRVEGLLHPASLLNVWHAPYKTVLTECHHKLVNTRRRLELMLAGQAVTLAPSCSTAGGDGSSSGGDYYETKEQLLAPLLMCYRSLHDCEGGAIADGRLLDLIRRVHAFGMCLMKVDLRQERERHTQALDEITRHLGLGSYARWDEDARLAWLARELAGRRPLIPVDMPMSDDVREVLDTFCVAAALGPTHLGAYVISMARSASDVLAVELLQKEARALVANEHGRGHPVRIGAHRHRLPPATSLRVVPLFETVGDLRNAGGVLRQLLSNAWFRDHLVKEHGAHQEVMVGYSDSGKESGRLCASWELYRCQQEIVAVLDATLSEAHAVPARWHELMDRLASTSRAVYRSYVYDNPLFLKYFHEATPIDELADLNIGSRPARRSSAGDVGSLRAIPWIFAWTQTRFILPAWLGVGEALEEASSAGFLPDLQHMYEVWPPFRSTIDLLEMVLVKVEPSVAARYDQQLVSQDAAPIGEELRRSYHKAVALVLAVSRHQKLSQSNKSLRRIIENRNPYLDPINILQL